MNPAASLAICPTHNAKGKRDVTGAFLPEARAFTELRAAEGGVFAEMHQFDNRAAKWRRRREVEGILDAAPYPLTHVAIFCHGYRRGLQTGHTTFSVSRLAAAIARNSTASASVALYACDTARDGDNQRNDDTKPGPGGEGGFADKLRDELLAHGMRGGHIDAHPVTAHTTKAPYVRRFYVEPEAQDLGGDWLIAPGSAQWRVWRLKLRQDRRFRLSFPLMSTEAIRAAL